MLMTGLSLIGPSLSLSITLSHALLSSLSLSLSLFLSLSLSLSITQTLRLFYHQFKFALMAKAGCTRCHIQLGLILQGEVGFLKYLPCPSVIKLFFLDSILSFSPITGAASVYTDMQMIKC